MPAGYRYTVDKAVTNLPSIEGTPMAGNFMFAHDRGQTFDRYSYIAKANYEGSSKKVHLKMSDR